MSDVAKKLEGLSASKLELLARRLAEQKTSAARARITPQPRESGTFPLSFAQERLWFLDQLLPGSPMYVMAGAAHLVGPLDMDALMRSINAVVQRHEVLRMNIAAVDGRPVPVVAPERTIVPRVIDLRDLPLPARAPAAQRLMAGEARRTFDLASDPLLRALALRLADEDHLVLLTMHHIVSDGWSTKILFQEIAAFYEAFTAGQPAPLPDPTRAGDAELQYADYAIWQRQWLQGEIMQTQLAYWKRQLAGAPAILELPTDHPRPSVPSSRGARHPLQLSPSLTGALKELSRREGVTLFMVLLAAFKTLLYRYTGQTDVLIGTPIAGRTRPEIERLIGCFLNMLVLRTDLAGNPTFHELLGRVRQVALDAYAHQDIPFEKLVDELAIERNTSHSPLYQVAFSFEDSPTQAVTMRDLTLTFAEINTGTAKVDLSLELTDEPEGLAGWFEYSTDLFEPATIARMAGHFQTVLEHVAARPDLRLADVPLLTEAERRQILVEWNDTRADYPLQTCIHDLFETQAQRTPEAIAVAMGDQMITYGELSRRSNQLAHHLRTLGVGPEVFVGLCVERSIAMVVGVLGILKAGGAYVPLDPNYPAGRLAVMLEDARPAVLLTHGTMDDGPRTMDDGRWTTDDTRLEAKQPTTIVRLDTDWPAIAAQPDTPPHSGATPDNLAYAIYTSGSTGTPKGVIVAHRELVNHTCAFIDNHDLDASDRVLQFISLNFDASAATLFPPLLTGATLVLPATPTTELSSSALLQLCAEQQITVIHLPASFWHQWVDDLIAGNTRMRVPLKVVLVGGESPSLEKLHAWTQLIDHPMKFLNAYGPTETVITATIFATMCTPEALRGLTRIPIGRPLPNKQIYLLDAYLQPVPVGVPGEVYVGGIGLARGYLNRPDLTAARFVPNPFGARERWSAGALERGSGEHGRAAAPHATAPQLHSATAPHRHTPSRLYRTGDMARYLPDGSIEFLGRADQQVKIRGFRIELGEIEATLAQHPAVLENVVVVREDPPGVRRLVAYVVVTTGPRAGGDGPRTGELRTFLKTRLPDYMVPATFVFLDALPLTEHGKVDRRALPTPDRARPDLNEGFVAPRTPVEEQLATIWGAALGLEHVGIHDNFFELGGDSILSIQIVARANQVGLRLTPQQMFQHQTIAELAAVAGSAVVVQAEQGPVTGPVPLTPIQHWFFEQQFADPHHWNQAILLEARQPLDPARLEQAVQALLAHHDALRLRCTPTESGWQQVNAAPDAHVPVSYVDVAALAEAQRTQVIATTAAELQAGLNLAHGPLLRVAFFDAGADASGRLLIIIHHLAVDGVSWRILVEDLQTAYRQLSQDEPVHLPPKTTAFKQWAERLVEYAQSADLAQEANYWRAASQTTGTHLPLDHAHGPNSEASARSVSIALAPDETRTLLQEVPSAYHTQINDVLLTALAQAFAAWTGARVLRVNLEGHGREELFEDIDLSRTVGWFTTSFPVRLDLPPDADPGTALTAIKEQLRAIPRRGMGYGLLRYLSGREELAADLRAAPPPEVSFNYLGQIDQGEPADALFAFTRAPTGPARSPSGLRSHVIEINALVAEGRLQLDWTYSANLHAAATIETLAGSFLTALRTLIAHCTAPEAGGYTPSDFPEVALSQAQLEQVLAEIDLDGWED